MITAALLSIYIHGRVSRYEPRSVLIGRQTVKPFCLFKNICAVGDALTSPLSWLARCQDIQNILDTWQGLSWKLKLFFWEEGVLNYIIQPRHPVLFATVMFVTQNNARNRRQSRKESSGHTADAGVRENLICHYRINDDKIWASLLFAVRMLVAFCKLTIDASVSI